MIEKKKFRTIRAKYNQIPPEVAKNRNDILFQVLYPDGDEYWFKNNKLHRGHDGGPALIRSSTRKIVAGKKVMYFIDDKEVTKEAAQVYALLFGEKTEEEEEEENDVTEEV